MRITGGTHARAGLRAWNTAVLLALTGLSLAACQQDQPTSPAIADDNDATIDFTVTPEAIAVAKAAVMVGHHKLPTIPLRQQSLSKISASVSQTDNSPFDLTHFGGAVVTGATSYAVYVGCPLPETPAMCWGTGTLSPTNFLNDLNRSPFIRVVNEYIGTDAMLKFPAVQMRAKLAFATANRATMQEIQQIVAGAVLASGKSGYNTIYHIFLRQGVSVCIVPGNCYSPDDPASWAFCAFHGSVNLSPTQHVLVTVQPYQDVDGCRLPGQTPNGRLDATASTLSHELFETITDPDFDGWSNALFGYEISDMCSVFGSNLLVNTHHYFIQSEYSNTRHLCTTQAPGV
jgi:hypothetical protein